MVCRKVVNSWEKKGKQFRETVQYLDCLNQYKQTKTKAVKKNKNKTERRKKKKEKKNHPFSLHLVHTVITVCPKGY